ncbi:MAG: hypothetical protein AAGA77_14255 [Bacteroidota bacterium]
MRNIVGQTATGKDFYPRPQIIKKIYRRLDSGSDIFMAAPRRVGKTSIMLHLQDEPKSNYDFVYIITESAKNPEEYFKRLLTEMLRSKAISKLAKTKENTKGLILEIIDRIGSIEVPGFKMELNDKEESVSFYEQFEKLLTKLNPEKRRIVIMVDEFPTTIENIKKEKGEDAAQTFLQQNRELRQKAHENIQFIYTGSIGLPLVVKKIMTLNVIADLNIIEVPPLSLEQAKDMVTKLLNFNEVKYDEEVIEYLLKKLEWYIPFHIQLIVQELIDVYDVSGYVKIDSVDKAFMQLLHTRNDTYFNHYYSRLKDSFQNKNEYTFALEVLKSLANNDYLDISALEKIAEKHNIESDYNTVIDSLIFDGYIDFSIDKNKYSFNSQLLKKWWANKNL